MANGVLPEQRRDLGLPADTAGFCADSRVNFHAELLVFFPFEKPTEWQDSLLLAQVRASEESWSKLRRVEQLESPRSPCESHDFRWRFSLELILSRNLNRFWLDLNDRPFSYFRLIRFSVSR
jgi:hypothetical protein